MASTSIGTIGSVVFGSLHGGVGAQGVSNPATPNSDFAAFQSAGSDALIQSISFGVNPSNNQLQSIQFYYASGNATAIPGIKYGNPSSSTKIEYNSSSLGQKEVITSVSGTTGQVAFPTASGGSSQTTCLVSISFSTNQGNSYSWNSSSQLSGVSNIKPFTEGFSGGTGSTLLGYLGFVNGYSGTQIDGLQFVWKAV